ncbi:unnamed protein product [Laminaria digitata]
MPSKNSVLYSIPGTRFLCISWVLITMVKRNICCRYDILWARAVSYRPPGNPATRQHMCAKSPCHHRFHPANTRNLDRADYICILLIVHQRSIYICLCPE